MGNDEVTKSIKDIIEQEHPFGFHLVGHDISDNYIATDFNKTLSICVDYKARILVHDENGKVTSKIKRRLAEFGIKVFKTEDFYELITGMLPILDINGKSFGIESNTEKAGFPEFLSRFIGLLAFCITLPLYPIIMIGIRLDSKGKIFFIDKRLGKDGKPFNFIKFRTMVENPDRKNLEINWMNTFVPEAEHSDITPFGCILRKFKIDELPQFINLMKGEMNLIGPRPERPKAFEERLKIVPFYEKRLSVKPGITGWAQVHPFKSAKAKLQFDLFYIKHRSLALDLYIILRTIWIMACGNKRVQ